jgi:hypothetical protein
VPRETDDRGYLRRRLSEESGGPYEPRSPREPGPRYGYGGFREDMAYREDWMNEGPHIGLGPKGYSRSDERIEEDANERLTRHGRVDARNVAVSVENGEITLEGTVDSRLSKRLAEDALETISGVRDIHNRLRITQRES